MAKVTAKGKGAKAKGRMTIAGGKGKIGGFKPSKGFAAVTSTTGGGGG
jgi:hypothetical protein